MWTKEMFGTDVYHLVAAFIIYSMLGWLVESIYMSICNKKLTNRGFGKGPFCPSMDSEQLSDIWCFGHYQVIHFCFTVREPLWLLYSNIW